MYFQRFYLDCLAHASYLIGSEGEAAVIDPRRDVDEYITEADKAGLKIKYVIETHLHADFVSGHLELSERTGAKIALSSLADAQFAHVDLTEGMVLKVGSIELKVLETPGHTLESICLLAHDSKASGEPDKLFTGDTLFYGDVGRPDLAAASNHSAEEMAGYLYDSLHNKILNLNDDVEVYPAHGAGSLCGKKISAEVCSTIGAQKLANAVLHPMSRSKFIAMVVEGQPEIPAYFEKAVEMNRAGAKSISLIKRPIALNAAQAKNALERGAILVDVRDARIFAAGHIRGAFNIGLRGNFASWVGTLLKSDRPLILAASDVEMIDEAVRRLSRIGIDSVAGFLELNFLEWQHDDLKVVKSGVENVQQLYEKIISGYTLQILDVRRTREFESGHISNAINIPLAELMERWYELQEDTLIAVVCASGYRSSIGQSILEHVGLTGVVNISGGTAAWKAAGYPVDTVEKVTV